MVGRSWISEVQNRCESNSDDLQLPEKQITPRRPKQDLPGRLSGDFRINKLEKTGGEGKRKYPARPCKVCAAHKRRSETIYHTSRPIRRTMTCSLEILEKNNGECILILVIYWKKTRPLIPKLATII